ncbi:hypothetical protein M378DRAFT_157021 [Amanita muscaria Koide BX008]|uniref:Pkinase-domain-containing protein n=1 Tax=Amanita muscaria (strain Koide BX008) TaxID=946122 RepID=A0A0C2T1T9_AMAMK|nr:hypothetical protein M378DRAFT_157021 [Amanita muscaria Koide BX008]
MSQPSSPASPNAQQRSFINLSSSSTSSRSYFDPPQGVSYTEFIKSWSDVHVARWLADIKCTSYAPTFKANDIRGDIILDLDQVSLMEMGVLTVGDRLRILDAIKTLRLRVQGRNVPPISTSWPAKATESQSSSVQDRMEPSPSTKRRLDVGRPAPLQLQPNTGRSNLPDLIRDPDSARTIPQVIRPLPRINLALQDSATPVSAQSNRSNLPPAPPPPRHQPPPPPPPTQAQASTRTPSRPTSNDRRTPTPSELYSHHPLPPAPPAYQSSPESRVTGKPSPLPYRSVLSSASHTSHGRNGSLQVPSQSSLNGSNKLPQRPSTATSVHPYANVQPTLQVPPGPQGLSPIAESFATLQSSASGSTSQASQSHAGPRTGYSPSHNNAPSLGDLRWKLVKFICPDEESSFTIDVTPCANGIEVLEKVLKKFGKSSRNPDLDSRTDTQANGGGLTIDGWGVYLETGDDIPGEPLTEAELMSICHAPPDHPSREPGLYLRRTVKSRRAEDHSSSSSPQSMTINSAMDSTKATKRASTISVLSGLGVRDLEPPSSTSSGRVSPAALSASARRPSKLRNFFGQRPPSELITNHLSDFFPFTEKKVLERTARNSMMFKSGTRRDSSASSFVPPLPSRFSTSTQGSGATTTNSPRASIVSFAPQPIASSSSSVISEDSKVKVKAEELPRMSLSTDDGHSTSLDIESETTTAVEPKLLPPIPFPSESLSDSLQNFTAGTGQRGSRPMSIASRRMSYMTELRSKRDRSDTASMVTVDEITAEVESKCATDNTVGKSEQSSDTDDGWTRVGTDEGQESGEDANDDFEEEDDEATLQNEDVPVDAVVTKKANKWIKGALIGAGSFGKVYLGMDAATGFLMAVKQVELPTGSGPNEDRKKSMLSALEREIELLKNLQHENIVQYLYSSIEDDHLNIFLEYVPGGSLTGLLSSYGAFEEPLVKNFVRQILEGLNYLHERDIMHRDIKGGNILVDNKGGVKISDFGISKKVDTNLLGGNRVHRPSLQGSVFWMAPEVVKQSGHTKKADIWSVGCLVVEMLTGEHPWAQLTQMQAIFKIGSSEKPAIPSDISAEAQDFLQRTFELNYVARPCAAELLHHPWIAKPSF